MSSSVAHNSKPHDGSTPSPHLRSTQQPQHRGLALNHNQTLVRAKPIRRSTSRGMCSGTNCSAKGCNDYAA